MVGTIFGILRCRKNIFHREIAGYVAREGKRETKIVCTFLLTTCLFLKYQRNIKVGNCLKIYRARFNVHAAMG